MRDPKELFKSFQRTRGFKEANSEALSVTDYVLLDKAGRLVGLCFLGHYSLVDALIHTAHLARVQDAWDKFRALVQEEGVC